MSEDKEVKLYGVTVREVQTGVNMGDHGQDVFSMVEVRPDELFIDAVNRILQKHTKYVSKEEGWMPDFENYLIVQLVEPAKDLSHE